MISAFRIPLRAVSSNQLATTPLATARTKPSSTRFSESKVSRTLSPATAAVSQNQINQVPDLGMSTGVKFGDQATRAPPQRTQVNPLGISVNTKAPAPKTNSARSRATRLQIGKYESDSPREQAHRAR